MTRCWITVVGLALLTCGVAAAQDAAVLESDKARLSYTLGMNFGNRLQDQSMAVDSEFSIQEFRDAPTGGKTLLTEADVQSIHAGQPAKLKQQQNALQDDKRLLNKQTGEAFLVANKDTEGVITLKSGLQYKILEAGHGDKPTRDDTVVVHYRGALVDGSEFDSSYQRGQPATFAVNQVIRGWGEALQLMPVGSKWQLFIPPHLAYGTRGTGHQIGPNATLIFEVELLAIKGPPGGAARVPASIDTAAVTDNLTDIQASFKLDPRLTRSLYMGERWVTPPTFASTHHAGDEYTLELRVHGIDDRGRRIPVDPEWIPSDPDMVVLSSVRGDKIKITVKHAGVSTLNVSALGFTKKLLIKATNVGNAIQVEISQ
ncbi:MAG: FKBP-type peptidyl-prolyl cis-trans isomerase [Gammaproteobacteria bacterium]